LTFDYLDVWKREREGEKGRERRRERERREGLTDRLHDTSISVRGEIYFPLTWKRTKMATRKKNHLRAAFATFSGY
jgi:hypothetical protein